MTDDLQFLERPIEDWSLEGRRAFVEEHRWQIANALDKAFTTFLEDNPVASLTEYGFGRDGDPITEAVEFCIDRFENGDIDESKIYPAHRGCILFTRVSFWLAQKVGKQAYKRIRDARTTRDNALDYEHVVVDEDTPSAEESFETGVFSGRIAEVMPEFHERVGMDMLGAWLVGSAAMRRELFGWSDVSVTPSRWSSKERSFFIADALFRFLDVFFKEFEPAGELSTAHVAYDLCTRAPFDDAKNYRRLDATVGAELDLGSREVTRARKGMVVELLRSRVDELAGDAIGFLEKLLIRSSLKRSILHVHRIDLKLPEVSALLDNFVRIMETDQRT